MFALLLSPLSQTFAVADPCKPTFFGLEPWYQYLKLKPYPDCGVQSFTALSPGQPSSFLLIGLVVLDDLIRIAALVAVGYVIYGGILFVTSQGSPDATKKARETIINALIGLVVAIIAASVVAFIGTQIGT